MLVLLPPTNTFPQLAHTQRTHDRDEGEGERVAGLGRINPRVSPPRGWTKRKEAIRVDRVLVNAGGNSGVGTLGLRSNA